MRGALQLGQGLAQLPRPVHTALANARFLLHRPPPRNRFSRQMHDSIEPFFNRRRLCRAVIANHFVPLGLQKRNQFRPDEPAAASDQYSHCRPSLPLRFAAGRLSRRSRPAKNSRSPALFRATKRNAPATNFHRLPLPPAASAATVHASPETFAATHATP